ncbi:PREDICTED: protein gar2-like isoform X2 [Nelumbo nucifera]|uniref:Protein gar2-like isoform X2 n=1 Tax=Nelumbo nucifera TaxID=4432 RepID=A0A1U8Q5N1_NELNU|nr:PREDICTED: protein gar2-like isoform X2 [Nelumbo nucifera]
MRTRNAETPKSGATKKAPAKRSAIKTPTKPSEGAVESTTPTSAETKPASTTVSKPSKNSTAAAKPATPLSASKPEAKVEDASTSVDTAQTTPETKAAPAAKSSAKKTSGKTKTPSAAKASSAQNPKPAEAVSTKVDKSTNKEDQVGANIGDSSKEEPAVAAVGDSQIKEEIAVEHVKESHKKEDLVVAKVQECSTKKESVIVKGDEEVKDEIKSEGVTEASDDKKEPVGDLVKEDRGGIEGENAQTEENEDGFDDGIEDFGEQEGFEGRGDEERAEEEEAAWDEDAAGLEEQLEISAAAKERKMKKEHEIFVGGLDRDAVEEDVRIAFESIGEIVEVRLHRNPSTNKNKGFAFVKFADKEHATRALSELKNPIIRGKRCGTAPSEDNDTLFLGNICNTWTKEAIKQKLKEYGIEGIENITLVPDPQHEGLSRGFAFLEFSCHADAMQAYKRLQKTDVIFGHAERTAKVAFAEPLREPDPEVMSQVKSVFVDGLPPHWDEDHVREHFKEYGEIERIVLARNMSTAKRKDFGFVDFTTHEAAIACIDGVNGTELGDGKSKTKVKVRLSNPLPKTQAVKGDMRGGFRIGRSGIRGFGRGARPFIRGKNFYPRGQGQTGRFAFADDIDYRGRRAFSGQGLSVGRRPDRPRNVASERTHGKQIQSRRQAFSSGDFNRPYGGRYYVDDPYLYERGHGMKRPFSMVDQEPSYFEPSGIRPRYGHPEPASLSRSAHYRDSFGPGGGLYSHDYYGSDYGRGPYSSLYGDRPFGGGYYY